MNYHQLRLKQEGRLPKKPRPQKAKAKPKNDGGARKGGPRGERKKTKLRREQAERARKVLHAATPERNVASKKGKNLSPQERAAQTRRNSLTRKQYYAVHQRIPNERSRGRVQVVQPVITVASKAGQKVSQGCKKTKRPDSLPPWRIIDELTGDLMNDVERWILSNLRTKGKPNLTADILAEHINSKLKLSCCEDEPMTKSEARALLNYLGYSWKKLKNGYYARKTLEPRVVKHRDEYIVAMEAMYSRPDLFHLICTDESGFRVNFVEQWGWCKAPEDVYDMNNQTGPGQGYNMLDFMDQNGLLFRKSESGPSLSTLVGHVMKTVAPSQRKNQGDGKRRGRKAKQADAAQKDDEAGIDGKKPPKKRHHSGESSGIGASRSIHIDDLNVESDKDFEPDLEEEKFNARPKKRRTVKTSLQFEEAVPGDQIVRQEADEPANAGVVEDTKRNKSKVEKEDYYKMDAEKFQSGLKEAIRVVKEASRGTRSASKHVVFFGDGSSVHLVMEDGAWNPNQMNWAVPSEKKPVTLKQKLEDLGLGEEIPSKQPKGGWVSWAREKLLATEEFSMQLTAGERIACQNGCYMLYGPVASPYFNPKENFYRFVKSRIRKANGPSLAQLEAILDECCKDLSVPERCVKWYKRAHGFRLWFSNEARIGKAVLAPTERQIGAALRWGLLDVEKEQMQQKIHDWLCKVSTTSSSPQFPDDIDPKKLREVLRSLNVQRYKRGVEDYDEKCGEVDEIND